MKSLLLFLAFCFIIKGPVLAHGHPTLKNGQFQLLKAVSDRVDTSGTFKHNDSLNLYTYDNARLTGIRSSAWDSTKKAYFPNSYDSFLYSAQGLLTSHLIQIYNSGKFYNLAQELHYYDSAGLDTLMITQSWNASAKSWSNNSKERRSYNASFMKAVLTEMQWSLPKKQWINSNRTSYTYNSIGNTDKILNESWNGTGWDSSQLTSFTYNSSNNVTEMLLQDVSPGQVQDNYRTMYTYGSGAQVAEILAQFWDGSAWQPDTKITMNYNSDGNVSDDLMLSYNFNSHKATSAEHTVYTYQFFTGIAFENPIESHVSIFPVPAKNELTVTSTERIIYCEAYTMDGKQVYRQYAGLEKYTFEISQWPAGAYILKIQGEHGAIFKKILKD